MQKQIDNLKKSYETLLDDLVREGDNRRHLDGVVEQLRVKSKQYGDRWSRLDWYHATASQHAAALKAAENGKQPEALIADEDRRAVEQRVTDMWQPRHPAEG